MSRARARHILMYSKEACETLKSQIASGEDFAELARKYSQCPSGRQGGELGEFTPDQIVAEFADIVFREDVGKVCGPIKSPVGYHLVEVTARRR